MIKGLLSAFHVLSLIAIAAVVTVAQNGPSIAPKADHHQHLFSPAYVSLTKASFKPVMAEELIANLDKAGIQRAVVLSTAYRWGRPGGEPPDEYAGVKAENDWTAAQAGLYPERLIAFCGFNPLKDYALEELDRCSKVPALRRGIKLHLGNSDVQLEKPEHFEKLKGVFQAANQRRMAIVVHIRASFSLKRPYGAEQARRFLDLLAFAPDITVQVAHMASSGPGYSDPPGHEVLKVLADSVEAKDKRTRNLWFDFASNPHPNNPPEISDLLVKLIRQIGVKRVLYGSDGSVGGNLLPHENWAALRAIKLTEKEIKTIAKNVAPYFR